MIYICGVFDMADYVHALRPGYLISIIQSEFQPPTPPEIQPTRHLRIAVDDISLPMDGATLPGEAHVRELVGFLRDWPADEPLLVHCFAGVSRSTAAALIALAIRAPGREQDAAEALRNASSHASPNRRIIALADQLLGLDGRLYAAREEMSRPGPIVEGALAELPLLG